MGKDWKGNGNSVYKALGASNHTDKERETDDFYATEPKAVDLLLDYIDIQGGIWESSCGSGCLSERIEQRGYEVVSTDLVYRGYGKGNVNFFECDYMPEGCNAIVTNPPYKYATEYVIHGLGLLEERGLLCLFLKTTFAEGKERYARIFSVTPPKYVLQCSERVLCAKNGEFELKKKEGSAVSYAWWVWEKGYTGPTILDWINHPKVTEFKQNKLF